MNILVGLTERPESQAALQHAIEEARYRSARLHVIRSVGNALNENPGKARQWAVEMGQLESEGEQLVRDLATEGIDATYRVEPVTTDASEVLLDAARTIGADLIVIGVRRRSPVGKVVAGSVSQEIILRADCPVLAVKADRG